MIFRWDSMVTAYCNGWGQGAIDWRGGRWPPGSYNFLDLRNLNLYNATLRTHHIPPPHFQVHERGKYDICKSSHSIVFCRKKARVLSYDFHQHVSTSDIRHNQSPQPTKSRASQKSIRTTLSDSLLIPSHAYSRPQSR